MDDTNQTPKRILIVEDDQFIRELYNEILQAEGYSTALAVDGEEGLAKVMMGGWDLILLDVMLPKKDGLQILRDSKASPPKAPNGPIVVLTNLGSEDVIKQAFALGAAGYLIKSSMNPDQVLLEVKNFLSGQPTPQTN